jgi:hypothetical protein
MIVMKFGRHKAPPPDSIPTDGVAIRRIRTTQAGLRVNILSVRLPAIRGRLFRPFRLRPSPALGGL